MHDFCGAEYEQMEKDAGHPDRAAIIFERSIVAAQLVDERLTVSPPLPGDFASAGMWIGADDLRGQDAAIVRQTAGVESRFRRTPDSRGPVLPDTRTGAGRVSQTGREKRKLNKSGLGANAGGENWRWREKMQTEKSNFVDKSISTFPGTERDSVD